MKTPFASLMISEVARGLGIAVELEPDYGFSGEIIFPGGRRHLFRNTNLNINPCGSVEIAKDKGYTKFFLTKHGFRVPQGKTFFSSVLNNNLDLSKRCTVEDAVEYASDRGFPVFVKPNNLSQGSYVTRVFNTSELRQMAEKIFERVHVAIVEEPCPGRDYRVVVLGGHVISAYERIPLCVTGDGVSTIGALLGEAKEALPLNGRPNAEIDLEDIRIDWTLKNLGLSRDYVVPPGMKVQVLSNANLSNGGTSVDVTETIHPAYADIAVRASRAMGLRLCGVDFMCDDITDDPIRQHWSIIELNAAPGLDNYAALGTKQTDNVRNLYKKILQYLADN